LLVCQCKWLTYNDLRETIAAGAQSLEALQSQCGAGTECGGCREVLQEILADTRRDSRPQQDSEECLVRQDVNPSSVPPARLAQAL